jgi:hypothetical protein
MFKNSKLGLKFFSLLIWLGISTITNPAYASNQGMEGVGSIYAFAVILTVISAIGGLAVLVRIIIVGRRKGMELKKLQKSAMTNGILSSLFSLWNFTVLSIMWFVTKNLASRNEKAMVLTIVFIIFGTPLIISTLALIFSIKLHNKTSKKLKN